jgi:hypothetical protein
LTDLILYGPRIPVCFINLTTLPAMLRSLSSCRRLSRPGKCPSSRRRSAVCFLHWSRTWATVCRPSPQSHFGSIEQGALPLAEVLVWLQDFRVGAGVCRKVARPRASCCHCTCHLLWTTLRDHCFSVDFKECRIGGCCVLGPGGPLCLHPEASLAARSAASLP